MKINKIVTSIITATLLSTNAFAGGDFVVEPNVVFEPIEMEPELAPVYYVGIGATAMGLSRDCACKNGKNERLKDMTYGVLLKAGINITDYIGIEARYINTSIESDFSEVEHYGLYLKPQYMLNEEAKVYGLLGYGKTTVDYVSGRKNSILSESGLSFGAGFEYAFDDNIGLWVDMQHIFSGEGVYKTDLNLGAAGVSYNF